MADTALAAGQQSGLPADDKRALRTEIVPRDAAGFDLDPDVFDRFGNLKIPKIAGGSPPRNNFVEPPESYFRQWKQLEPQYGSLNPDQRSTHYKRIVLDVLIPFLCRR